MTESGETGTTRPLTAHAQPGSADNSSSAQGPVFQYPNTRRATSRRPGPASAAAVNAASALRVHRQASMHHESSAQAAEAPVPPVCETEPSGGGGSEEKRGRTQDHQTRRPRSQE